MIILPHKSSRSKKILIMITLLLLLIPLVSALDYFSYQMNFQNGEARNHSHSFTYTGNLTINKPAAFSITNTTGNPTVNGNTINWSGSGNVSFVLESPASCTEGTTYNTNIYLNGTFQDEFIYVCTPDNKIIDYKAEYGHGDANYLSDLYISNESVTLFNLIRVWNIGSYLDPDEDADNVSIKCYFENYPVRTYGRAEVDHGTSQINGTFSWSTIAGGYWFRIGVISQDISGKGIGGYYNISCDNLVYDFDHNRVNASFSDVSIEIRDTSPFNFSFEDISGQPSYSKVTITNKEKYPAFDIFFDKTLDSYQVTERLLQLAPGESASYKIDRSNTYNFTVHFIPSWYRNSRNPVYYEQYFQFNGSNVSTESSPAISSPGLPEISFLEDTNYTGLDLDDYVSDDDNADSDLNWSYSGNTNITVSIDNTTHIITLIPDPNFYGTENITLNVTDPYNNTASNILTVNVLAVNDFPVISSLIPDQNRGLDFSSWTLNLTPYESDVEDSNINLIWNITGVDSYIVAASLNQTTDIVTFSVLQNITGEDKITLTLYDGEGASDAQEIAIRFNMSIPLYEGWNLFSIPPVDNNSIINILGQFSNDTFGCGRGGNASVCNVSDGDFNGSWRSIQTYNESDGTWLVFNPSDYYTTIPGGQEIQTIETYEGYWIDMIDNATLNLSYRMT